jgi:hypothetical protein
MQGLEPPRELVKVKAVSDTTDLHLGFADVKILLCRETFRHWEDERKGELLRQLEATPGTARVSSNTQKHRLSQFKYAPPGCSLLQRGDNVKERPPPSVNPRFNHGPVNILSQDNFPDVSLKVTRPLRLVQSSN